jgi:twinkle protein
VSFVTHQPCPECGSSDALAVYEDGSHCFSCGHHTNDDTPHTPRQKPMNLFVPEFLDPVEIENRRLKQETCARYGVGLPEDRDDIGFPYYVDGECVAVKFRRADKSFYWRGEAKSARLFGMQACKDQGNLVITEGEFDALSLAQVMGPSYSVVSVPNGADSATKTVGKCLEWMDKFKAIYVAYDNDEPGNEAASKTLKLFEPGRAKRVVFPTGYKDASDLLQGRKEDTLKDCVYRAQEVQPEGVLDPAELLQRTVDHFYDKSINQGVSTGYAALDRLLGGFRAGELLTFTGATGIGKTAVVRQLVYNAMQQGSRVFFIPLEMTAETTLLQFAEMEARQRIYTNHDGSSNVPREKLTLWLEALLEHLYIYNHIGSLDPDKLCRVIEHVCRSKDINIVVLDHINAATQDSWDKIDALVSRLKTISIQQKVCLINVAHQSRGDGNADNKPSLDKVRGSAGIAQYSDAVIGVGRDRDSTTSNLTTLKAHRLVGEFGAVALDFDKNLRHFHQLDFGEQGEQYPQEENAAEPREDTSVPKQVRSDSSVQATPVESAAVRAGSVHLPDTGVDPQVHTRLQAEDQDGEDAVRGDEGSVQRGRQTEAQVDEVAVPRVRRKAAVPSRPFSNKG